MVLARCIYGLANGERILYTAHRTSTAHSIWDRLSSLCAKTDIEITSSFRAFGKEHLYTEDSAIEFRTRTSTGGLGEGYDLLIIDEAQEYTPEHETALKYVVTDSPNPQTIMFGTPPTAISAGTVFPNYRKRVLQSESYESGWAEWSVSEMSPVDDVDLWYETNPSLGTILKERTIRSEIGEDKTDFNIQRLGLWIKYNQKSAISRNEWEQLETPKLPKLTGPLFAGIKFGIDELFCCLSHDENEKIMSIMRFCDANFIKFYYVPRMIGNYNLNLKPEKFGSIHLFTNHKEPLRSFGNRLLKRSFDVVVSSLVCIVMLPFLPIIALIIKHQSPGPLLFKQKRTGMNGETFTCYKFRSMHVNKAADTQQATQDDPRKFPFGNFMRKSNLDEFPQFFNVLIGNMSIVGPRPHMLLHTEIYSEQIGRYMVRHFCKPGITGWAQVTGFRGETKELWQMEERIRRDIWYIENWSFSLDLQIIFLTFTSIFKHDKNAY